MSDWAHPPMPTPEQIRARRNLPGIEAACLVMLAHGINTDTVLGRDDALEPEGYLQFTGRVIDDEIEAVRVPWPDFDVWRELQPVIDETRRNLRNEL